MIADPIVATGLRREFAGHVVLDGVDLNVRAGELVALLGANGAGKTTLLRVLATLLSPTAGSLVLFGAGAHRNGAAVRRRIGWVGHESACYPDLTAEENLAFHAALHGVGDAAARTRELLAWAGLESAARRPVRTYSRGMSQRLALARALIHRPELLLLDEPWSGLDDTAARALDALLVQSCRAGHAVVLSTHDVARVAPIATRTAILHRGRVAWSSAEGPGDPLVLAQAYQAVVTGRLVG